MKSATNLVLALVLILIPAVVLADLPPGKDWRGNKYWKDDDRNRPTNRLESYQDPYRFYNHFDYRSDYHPHAAPPSSSFREHADQAIWQGARSGQLSVREEQELRDMEQHIINDQRRYTRDGYVDWGERNDVRQDEREFEQKLNHELHDGERRYWW